MSDTEVILRDWFKRLGGDSRKAASVYPEDIEALSALITEKRLADRSIMPLPGNTKFTEPLHVELWNAWKVDQRYVAAIDAVRDVIESNYGVKLP